MTEAEDAVIQAARRLASAFAAAEAEHGQFSTRSVFAADLCNALARLDRVTKVDPALSDLARFKALAIWAETMIPDLKGREGGAWNEAFRKAIEWATP